MMAAGQFTFVDAGWRAFLQGLIDIDSDSITAVLIDNAHIPNKTAENDFQDISANECTDADYSRQAATGLTWSKATARTFKLDGDAVDFAPANNATISARYIYLAQGAALTGTSRLLGYMDLNTSGGNVSSVAGEFLVDWNAANGLFIDVIEPA